MSVAAILLLVSLNFVWGLAAAAFFAQKLMDPSRGKGALMMALLLLGAPAALVMVVVMAALVVVGLAQEVIAEAIANLRGRDSVWRRW